MAELQLAPLERIIRRQGKGIRVAADAVEALRRVVEEMGMDVAERAVSFARHAGRKTVKAEDVELAVA